MITEHSFSQLHIIDPDACDHDIGGGAFCGQPVSAHSSVAFDLPNLLDGTEQFMQAARQLDNPAFTEHHNVGIRRLRRRLLAEEYSEYCDAEFTNNLVETVDGLLDVIVIAWGTLLAYLGPEKAKAAAAEVVRSNVSKIDGSLGPIVFRDDGKVLKPEGWTPPDIADAIS